MVKKSAPNLDELFQSLSAPPEAYIRTGVLPLDLMTSGAGLCTGGFIHLWGPNGTGKCVPAGTRIETSRGYLPIETLAPEPLDKLRPGFTAYETGALKVNSPSGFVSVDKFYYERSTQVLKLQLEDGSVVAGTPQHKVLGMGMNMPNDRTLVSLNKFVVGDYVLKRTESVEFKGVKKLTPSDFYLLGLWMGCGFTILSNSTGVMRFGYAGVNGSVPKTLEFITEDGQEYYRDLISKYYKNPAFRDTLIVPECVYSGSIEQRVEFIAGLWEACGWTVDGILSTDVSAEASGLVWRLCSEAAAYSVMDIFATLGVPVILRKGKGDIWDIHYVNLYGSNLEPWFLQVSKICPVSHVTVRKQNIRVPVTDHFVSALELMFKSKLEPAVKSVLGRARSSLKKGDVWQSIDWHVLQEAVSAGVLFDYAGYYPVKIVGISTYHASVFDLSVPDGHVFFGQGVLQHNTTALLTGAKELAKAGKKTLFVSVEDSTKLMNDMGLTSPPLKEFIGQISPVTYNEAQDVMAAFFESDYTLCIFDSVSALSTTSLYDGSSKKTIEDHLVAPDAMPRLRLIKWIHATMRRRTDKAVVLVFHASANFDKGWYGEDYVPEAGQKPQQFSAILYDGGRFCYL